MLHTVQEYRNENGIFRDAVVVNDNDGQVYFHLSELKSEVTSCMYRKWIK